MVGHLGKGGGGVGRDKAMPGRALSGCKDPEDEQPAPEPAHGRPARLGEDSQAVGAPRHLARPRGAPVRVQVLFQEQWEERH